MNRHEKRQRKVNKLTRYVIKIDEEQAYVFTFKAGTLFNKIKREMRKVAKKFGYTPYELFKELEFYELLTQPEILRLRQEILDEEAQAERSETSSDTTTETTEQQVPSV